MNKEELLTKISDLAFDSIIVKLNFVDASSKAGGTTVEKQVILKLMRARNERIKNI